MAEFPRVLSIVGRSGSGKTTLIEALLPWLISRGWRVGTLKHDAHASRMDHAGKDTYRTFEAGAERVAIVGPGEFAYRERLRVGANPEMLIERFFEGLDLVLAEGYKTGPWPKVEVVRAAVSREPTCLRNPGLRAFVTDVQGSFPIPVFGLQDIEGLGHWIEKVILTA
jgi:molybdopterin-guanine dinucleotide biosynthesis protein MobB